MDINFITNLITISILFSFSIYHFLLYHGRRKFISEKYNLYFSLFSFCVVLFILFAHPGTFALRFIKGYKLEINPPIAYLITIILVYFFVKILIELIQPSEKFNYISRSLFFVLALVELSTILSPIKGFPWFDKYMDFYLTLLTSAVSLIFIIIFIYYIITKKKYNDPVIVTFSIAFLLLGLYLIITTIILTKYENLQNSSNYGFVGIYIIFVAYSLSIKSNDEFKELIKLKNDLEIKVNERTKQIEAMSNKKTNYFLNLAHETKTPLTLIGNYLEKFIKENKHDDDLDIIKNNIDKMKNDFVNYFDMEKLISGTNFYDNDKIICISDVLEEKVKLFIENISKKPIQLQKDIEKKLYLKIDPYALDRIINNLIENAIKFTNQNSGKIYINLESGQNKIYLNVKDNGIGIKSDKLEKIFEPFYQIQHEKRNIQGMGLGLSIVKTITDSIKAEINVESKLNEGTCFSIIFNKYEPLNTDIIEQVIISKPTFAPDVKIHEDAFVKGRYNILIVEDNIQLLNFLHENISKKYNCFLALNGKEGLSKIGSMPKPDLIITDIMMDEMDGFIFYDELNKNSDYNNIPFIFLTAKTGKENRIEGLKKGAVDYITKPFIIDEVILKINTIIQNRNLHIESIKNKIINKLNDNSADQKFQKNFTNSSTQSLFEKYGITEKEKEIIKLLIDGLEYKEISDVLNIPHNTIKKNIQSIYKKCKVKNRIELLNIFH